MGKGRREGQVGDGCVEPNCGSTHNALLVSLDELTYALSFPHLQSWRTVYF